VFNGKEPGLTPNLGEVLNIMQRHATLLCEFYEERIAIPMFRKFCNWYIKDFSSEPTLREKLVRINTLAELCSIVAEKERTEPYPYTALRTPRGKSNHTQKVALPPDYLLQLDDDTPPGAEAEDATSGG
jgi:hypothetical protein